MGPGSDVSLAGPGSRNVRIRLMAGAVVVNLLVILMAGASLYRSRLLHQGQATAVTQNLVRVLDQYVADAFGKADLSLWAVKDEFEHPGTSPRDLGAFIARQHSRLPMLDSIRTANAQGQIEHGVGVVAGSRVSIAERDYFIRLKQAPDAGLVISEPVLGKISGKWVIILARSLENPDRSFAGVVYGVITLEHFSKTFSALNVGPHGSIAIRDSGLGLIARHPEPASAGTAIGDRAVSGELRRLVQSGQSSGSYRARTPTDHIERTFSFRKVSSLPIFVIVGLADQDYLSGWWRELLQTLMGVLVFVGLTLVSSWSFYRDWRRQRTANQALEKLLAEVKTLGGMLPICSHCKKIRDDKGYWNQLEAYLHEHTDADFTHGICPDCAREFFPGNKR